MKFNKCAWEKIAQREWTPARIKAAERKVKREKEKTPLFPELSPLQTVAQRIEEVDSSSQGFHTNMRAHIAKQWRQARRMFYTLHPITRAGIIRYWNESWLPKEASYFASLVRDYAVVHPHRSPWARLRYMAQLRRYSPTARWENMRLINPPTFKEHY